MKFNKYSKILLLLAGFSSCTQTVIISGNNSNTIQIPLVYASILAIPENDNEALIFAITSENVKYIFKSGIFLTRISEFYKSSLFDCGFSVKWV